MAAPVALHINNGSVDVPVSAAVPLPVSVKDLTVTADTINLDTADLEALLKPSAVAGVALTPVVTSALATSKVIKASAGNLYGLNLKTTSVAGTFLVHNAASAPAAGAVTPLKAYDCPANATLEISFYPPIRFGTGISVTFSTASTPFTQTDSATAFIEGDAS